LLNVLVLFQTVRCHSIVAFYTGWAKSRFTVESWFGPKNID